MGVAGLLKMISSCVHEVELSAYRGRKIAVDASCWLHRGTFACPIELAAGEPTDKVRGPSASALNSASALLPWPWL